MSNAKGGADPATGEVRYLAMGDSLTEGAGADDPNTTWSAILAAKWREGGCKVQFKNAGISGHTSDGVLQDEVPQIETTKATIITLQVGGNDIVQKVPDETYRTNVKAILAAAKSAGARIVTMTQNDWYRSPEGKAYAAGAPERRAALEGILEAETKAAGGEFVDLRAMFKAQADANMWHEGDIHPTQEAYTQWGNEMARVIPPPCK